ncbi:MAG: hypothetical protein ACEQSM_00480 [Aliarcobacter sp.]
MKRTILLALTPLWLASSVVLAEEPPIVPTVTPAEAATQEGKEVKVKGVIKIYEGKPSMDISSCDQIHVIEDPAATAPESKPSEPAT